MEIQWPLVFFSLFTGLGCGTIIIAVYLTEGKKIFQEIRQPALLIGLIALALGGMASTLHLGHPERILGALAHPTSGIFMEAAVMGLTGMLVIIYLLALRRGASEQLRSLIGWSAAAAALVLAFVNGDTYVMAAIPAWNTLLLPLFYIVSALTFGAFCTAAIVNLRCKAENTELNVLSKLVMVMLGVQAVLLAAYLAHVGMAPYPAESRSIGRIMAGDAAMLFWGGIIVLGFAVPAVLVKKSIKQAMTGLISVLAGGIAFRVMMFMLGSSVKQFFN